MNTTYTYQLFGITVQSEILLPKGILANGNPNVFIRYGKTPDKIDNAIVCNENISLSETEFLLHIDNIANFHVSNGNLIIIERLFGSIDNDILIYLLSSVMGALLHQRGMIAIHGSSIVFRGKGVIFAGLSGSGKSTIAAGLSERGYSLLADDLSVISIQTDGTLLLHPGYQHIKLWVETLEKMNKQVVGLKQIRNNVQKYVLPSLTFTEQPVAVNCIYMLSPTNTNNISIRTLKGVEKFNALNKNTFRRLFLQGIEPRKAHFQHLLQLSEKCIVKRIERPIQHFMLNEMMDAIEKDLTKELS